MTGSLDREKRDRYDLKISARDRGEPPKSSIQTLSVLVRDENDNGPAFSPRHYSAGVPENASVGATVLQVKHLLNKPYRKRTIIRI